MTIPLAAPAGVFWRAKIYKSFGLRLFPSLGFEASSFRQDEGSGLTVSPEISMDGVPISSADFALTATPQIGMWPQGFQLAVTPTIGMAAIPNVSFGLSVDPQLGITASSVQEADFALTVTPQLGMDWILAPAFDAVGPGAFGLGSGSWTHTATAGAFVIVDVVTDRADTVSATYGGQNMMVLSSVTLPGGRNGDGVLTRFGIANAPGGASTVAVTVSNSYVAANSVSYLNVKSFALPASTTGTGTTASQSVTPTSGLIVHSFGGTGTGTSHWTSVSGGTNRYNQTTNSYACLEMSGTSSAATFSATASASRWWAGLPTELHGTPFQAIAYDAIGNGATVKAPSPTLSWSHTLGAEASALLVAFHVWNKGLTTMPTGVSAQVGSTPMTQLLGFQYTGGDSSMYVFGLLNPPTGAQTASISMSSTAADCYVSANSVSYSGVTAFGVPANNSGSGTALSQAIGAPLVPKVFQMFASAGAGQISSYNETDNWDIFQLGLSPATLIGDAVGLDNNLNFTASATNGKWGSVAIPLL